MLKNQPEKHETVAGRGFCRRRACPALLLLIFLSLPLAAGGEGGSGLRPASADDGQAQTPTALIELDGTESINPDGGDMSYRWRQLEGPKVELSDPSAAKPYFRTGKPGLYRFELIVEANGLASEPVVVELEITRHNSPPIAKIPAEVFGQVGAPIEIDGRESRDPEDEPLSYRWRPLTRGLDIPPTSLNQPVLSFEPKLDGVFEVELVVSDGETVSPPVVASLIIKPRPRPPVARGRVITREIPTIPQPEQAMAPPAGARPVARIDGPAVAKVGEAVMLDARASRGPDSSRLEYLWRQKSGPFISDFELVFDGAAERFKPAKEGDYEFELVVSDGVLDSQPLIHQVRVVREADPPVAVVSAPERAVPGALVKMDATQSYDLAGSPLRYRWRQTGGPAVRNYVIDERTGDAAPAFHPPTAGRYTFELVVSNGKLQSKPLEINIEVGDARLPPRLFIEGPDVANAGDRVVITAGADADAGRNLSFVWKQLDGPARALPQTTGASAAFVPPAQGRYIFDLSALENGQIVATARRTIEVFAAAGAPPTADNANLRPVPAPAQPLPVGTPLPEPAGMPLPSIQRPAPLPQPTTPLELTPLLDMPAPSSAAGPQPGVPQLPPAPAPTPAASQGPAPRSGRPAAQIHPSTLSGGIYNFSGSATPPPLP